MTTRISRYGNRRSKATVWRSCVKDNTTRHREASVMWMNRRILHISRNYKRRRDWDLQYPETEEWKFQPRIPLIECRKVECSCHVLRKVNNISCSFCCDWRTAEGQCRQESGWNTSKSDQGPIVCRDFFDWWSTEKRFPK